MRELARFVMRGRLHAGAVAGLFGGLCLFLPPLSYLSGAAVGLVSLRSGWRDAAVVTMLAVAIASVIALFIARRPEPGMIVMLLLWLPVMGGCWVLRVTRSQGLVLLVMAVFAALLAIGLRFYTGGDVASWWQNLMQALIESRQTGSSNIALIMEHGSFELMNGFLTMLLGLSLMLTILLARWWQALLYNPGGFQAEFHALLVPKPLAVAATALGAFALSGTVAKSSIWVDLFMVSIMVYLIQGLAVIHGIVGGRGLSRGWLAPIYVGLFFFPPHVILGLVMVGLVDSLVDFRSRGATPS
ncbi:MAG: DUF2232 domain-containing protein [Gammaproteobacteria bacterium]